MVALTRSRNTLYKSAELLPFPVDTNTHIYTGGIIRLVAGLVSPAVTGSGTNDHLIIGVAEQEVDNNPGTAGAKTCLVRMPGPVTLFLFPTAADLANSNIGSIYDVMDDQTAQASTGDAPVLGRLLQIEATRLGWFDLTIRS